MGVEILPAYDKREEIKEMFSEYMDMLISNDNTFKEYLTIQNYDREIQDLEMKYGMPEGRLYILYYDDKPAGCIGMRKLDDQRCEMKRLYIREEYRGENLGRMLVERLMEDAKKAGYSQMLLDTLPFLESAIELYSKVGFYETDSYIPDSPMRDAIYMRKDL